MHEADEHADTPSVQDVRDQFERRKRSIIVKVLSIGHGFDHYRVSCDCDEFLSLGSVFSPGLFIENTICLACQRQARVEKIDA